MKRIAISVLIAVLIFIPLYASQIADSRNLVLSMDLRGTESHIEFGISSSEPYSKDGLLSFDDIEEIYLKKEDVAGELIESTVLYPYWILILSDDVDIEVSGGAFVRKGRADGLKFDWSGDLKSSSNDKHIASQSIVIGLDNGVADYSDKIIYSHRAASGIKSMSYVPMNIRTQDISGYPAGQYEAELIMKLIKN